MVCGKLAGMTSYLLSQSGQNALQRGGPHLSIGLGAEGSGIPPVVRSSASIDLPGEARSFRRMAPCRFS